MPYCKKWQECDCGDHRNCQYPSCLEVEPAEAPTTPPVSPSNSSELLFALGLLDRNPDIGLASMTALHGMLIDAGLVDKGSEITGWQAVQIATEYLQNKGI